MLNMMACIAKFPVRSSPKNHDIKTTLHKSQTGLSTIINKKIEREGGWHYQNFFLPHCLKWSVLNWIKISAGN